MPTFTFKDLFSYIFRNMSQNQSQHSHQNNSSQQNRRPRPRTGRTLLVKPSGNQFNATVLDGLQGLTTNHHTEKSNSYFLTFTTAQDALNGLKHIKKECGRDVRVKFAHYRVFFKLEGLTDSSDYNTVKTAHTNLIQSTGANVLYYRLYRKNNSYLECGDFTVDTKEGFDALLSADQHKTFSFDNLNGTHYRYKKNDQQSTGAPAPTA